MLLDRPPAFVAETVALAQHADLVLLVARPGVIYYGAQYGDGGQDKAASA